MGKEVLCASIQQLREQFLTLDWTYHDFPVGSQSEKMFCWPGPLEEEILICVHQSGGRQELFHRHDFFYFNFTYQGEYDSISFKYDNRITIREGELYAGQPFAGHALCVHDDKETTIIGVLIQRETFFRTFFRQCSPPTPGCFIFCLTRPQMNFPMNLCISRLNMTAIYARCLK